MSTASSTRRLAPYSTTIHVLLVRHAESYNNVIADQLRTKYGISPYTHGATTSIVHEYDLARMTDPVLSPLGYQQAKLLPQHPYWSEIDLFAATRAKRTAIYTSPLIRTMLTSIPLIRTLNTYMNDDMKVEDQITAKSEALSNTNHVIELEGKSLPISSEFVVTKPLEFRAELQRDFCERGGSYSSSLTDDNKIQNKRTKGSGREFLNRKFGNTHDARLIPEDGWWNEDGEGEEKDDEFKVRMTRVIHWLKEYAYTHAQRYHTRESSPDHLVIVCHADFIDSLLTQILNLGNDGVPRHVFYAANTSVSHLEITYLPPTEARRNGFRGQSEKNLGEPGSTFIVRVRTTNNQPVAVESNTPEADITESDDEP